MAVIRAGVAMGAGVTAGAGVPVGGGVGAAGAAGGGDFRASIRVLLPEVQNEDPGRSE